MRACMLFVTGLLVGVMLTSVAAQSSKSPNKGLVQLNHIGMNVPNLDEAVAFALAHCRRDTGRSARLVCESLWRPICLVTALYFRNDRSLSSRDILRDGLCVFAGELAKRVATVSAEA